MKTQKIPLPAGSLISRAMPCPDYADAFALDVPGSISPEQLPPLFFQAFPPWFTALLYLRQALAQLIGLKTAPVADIKGQLCNFQGRPGESIALFQVLEKAGTELLTGADDRHLDFRLSFFSIPQAGGSRLVLATTVRFNGWLGPAYFLPVKPIHQLAIPAILRRMARKAAFSKQ